jgi:pimeloyl-ACP methyl ester carboxylesterase
MTRGSRGARGAGLAVIASAVLGAACGSSSDTAASKRVTFTPCEGDYECATVEVPVDYADPNGAKIGISVLRAPAKEPSARLGAVVVNPGGPGQAFVERLATTYPVLSAAFSKATTKFDVVTFDWRGVGRSAPIACSDDALFERFRATDLTLETPGSLQAVTELRTALLSGCLAKADARVLGAMNTENAARDLDRIREALGEEKLNYLGFSYGTWLGATYATLFPDRVRAFALDSATVLARDLEGDIAEQGASYELGFTRFFEACARDSACALRGAGAAATDPAAVGQRLDALVTKAKAEGGLAAGARRLSLVDLHFALADGVRTADWRGLASDLAAAEAGDATKLLDGADTVMGRTADGHYDTTLLGLLAIACVDQPFSGGVQTVDAFQAFAASQRAAHPRGTAALLPWALCAGWPHTRAGARLAVSAAAAPKALVISGRFDPITGYAQGADLVSQLGNGSSLLTYEGDGHAAALHSACVREVVTQFLFDPSKPPTKTSCPAE